MRARAPRGHRTLQRAACGRHARPPRRTDTLVGRWPPASIVTSQPDVACDVCGRRLLRGEQPDVFLAGGRRRRCASCALRAPTTEGWLRETDAPARSACRRPGRGGGATCSARLRRPRPSRRSESTRRAGPWRRARLAGRMTSSTGELREVVDAGPGERRIAGAAVPASASARRSSPTLARCGEVEPMRRRRRPRHRRDRRAERLAGCRAGRAPAEDAYGDVGADRAGSCFVQRIADDSRSTIATHDLLRRTQAAGRGAVSEARRALRATRTNVTVIVDRRESDRRARGARRSRRTPSGSSASSATAAAPACPAICRRWRGAVVPRVPSASRLHNRRRVKAIVHVDGGARGNPGPAAAACVISTPTARSWASTPSCSARSPTTSPSTARCCSASRTRASSASARSRSSATPS